MIGIRKKKHSKIKTFHTRAGSTELAFFYIKMPLGEFLMKATDWRGEL
jgi:hypothetical protein